MTVQQRNQDWTRPSSYSGRARPSPRKLDAGTTAASQVLFRPLPPMYRPQVTRSARILRVLSSIFLSIGVVAGIIALGWIVALGFRDSQYLAFLPLALVAVCVAAALLVRRHRL